MSAYVISDIQVLDAAAYPEYVALSPATVAAYGGRFVARGGHTEKLEGDWLPTRLVILEFESVERAKQWLNSPEYAPVKALRHKAARTNMVVIEGTA
ncbi:MAG TPA: DUF1330 domain-containing protein [Anaerolineales bacterium]